MSTSSTTGSNTRNASYDSPSKTRLNILEALMSHGGDGGSYSSESQNQAVAIKTQVSNALNSDPSSPNSPRKEFERRRRKVTLAPSSPLFQKNEELNTLLTTINKTNDISITLDDSKQILKIDNDVYVKMEYANAQVEDLMRQFSKAKQEFKEGTQRLQMEFEKMDKEKMEQIAAFTEDFNVKYSSMQKRYQDALSKKYKDKIEELAQKIENYTKERDSLKSKLEQETKKYYDDMHKFMSQYQAQVDEIRQKCEKEYAMSVQACKKNYESDLKKAVEKFNSQEKEYFAKYAIHKKLFFGLLTYLREVKDSNAKLEVELQKQLTKLESVNKKARKTENDLLNQISDLHKSIEQGKKFVTSKCINTDLTLQEMDKQDQQHRMIVQESACKIETLQEELAKCKIEIVSYRDEIGTCKEKYQQRERSLNDLRKQIEVLSSRESDLQKLLQEEKEKREKIQGLLDEAPTRENLNNLLKTVKEREEEVVQLKASLVERDQTITNFESKLEQLRLNNSEKVVLTSDTLELISTLKSQVELATKEKERLSNENTILLRELDLAKIDLAQKASEIQEIQERQFEKEKEGERLKMIHKEELEKMKQESEKKNEHFQTVVKEFQSKMNEQQTRISTLMDELDQQRIVALTIEQRNKERENELAYLTSSLDQSKEAQEKLHEQLQASNNKLQNILIHFEVERRNFEQEYQDLSSQNRALMVELEEKDQKIRTLQNEVALQTSITEQNVDMNDLSQMQKLITNLNRQIRTLRAEADLRDSVYRDERIEMKEKASKLEKEVSLYKDKYQTLLTNSQFNNIGNNNTSLLEENTKLSIENKKLIYANRTLIAKIAGMNGDASRNWEELYKQEQQKTEKLLEQCKNFVLRISQLEDENSKLKNA
ncbi:hypothetical protein FDP41_013474 [Naegleria fowleri]|uniref:Uncharacterized protein n=1 Tax=Naegleria fowleri TaxID=5763 RepID=A0A6A5C316_NAEFO|nr:uncharacterized protein FDP41_013474 [Naegleria fowleri]KAF0980260.1 hypothetical protein FDP41_013474 [Naegleria fowleri]